MSIIQRIREKGALISAIVIALALLGFIAMDAFTGRSNIFGGGISTTVGRVNGKRIDIDEFRNSIDLQAQNLESQGYPSGEGTRNQALEQAWNQQVGKILITDEIDKLGIRVSEKELSNSILFGNNPPEDLRRQFTNEQTGQYDPQLAATQINATLKSGSPEVKANLSAYINQQKFIRQVDKYNSMLINTTNMPKWMLEKQNADNSQLARISFVRKPYTDISDSAVKVTDKEIEDYISEHKDEFKQEESRSISYVSFPASPSAADSAAVRERLLALKQKMQDATDIQAFLAAEGAQTNFYNSYISGETIQIPGKDSIFNIPVGTVYGPYIDANTYNIAKLIDVRQIPDSVKVRHILIATTSRDQSGQTQVVRDTATAKAIADSVQRIIAAGQNFDSVAAKVSEDPGSKDKGGVYETGSGQMVPEFNDFMFTKPVGSKAVVKTDFGYHYMEVLSQKGSKKGYKIAYLSRPITASSETDRNARNAASDFAARSRDEKSFNANYEKELKPKGINKGYAIDIKPAGGTVMGLAPSRAFVKNIYEADMGEVLEPERVGSDYVVALVTAVYEEGTQPVTKARPVVEPLLRNKKKAELIKKEIGTITTLEAVASKLGKQVETADSLRMTGSQSAIGFEPKVLGAAFNPSNRGKVVTEVIEGSQGVYVVKVENVTATALADANVAEQKKMREAQTKMRYQQMAMQGMDPVLDALKKAAKIKDNRSEHF
ncbi:MAG TPA: peptidylprolyl isomerase [Chitinophagaceae bacterium]|nr:peptidylprolyl isomerase [Chitinophagaceae bacterium]